MFLPYYAAQLNKMVEAARAQQPAPRQTSVSVRALVSFVAGLFPATAAFQWPSLRLR